MGRRWQEPSLSNLESHHVGPMGMHVLDGTRSKRSRYLVPSPKLVAPCLQVILKPSGWTFGFQRLLPLALHTLHPLLAILAPILLQSTSSLLVWTDQFQWSAFSFSAVSGRGYGPRVQLIARACGHSGLLRRRTTRPAATAWVMPSGFAPTCPGHLVDLA